MRLKRGYDPIRSVCVCNEHVCFYHLFNIWIKEMASACGARISLFGGGDQTSFQIDFKRRFCITFSGRTLNTFLASWFSKKFKASFVRYFKGQNLLTVFIPGQVICYWGCCGAGVTVTSLFSDNCVIWWYPFAPLHLQYNKQKVLLHYTNIRVFTCCTGTGTLLVTSTRLYSLCWDCLDDFGYGWLDKHYQDIFQY